MERNKYIFTVNVMGHGGTIEEAWANALINFYNCPPSAPEEFELIIEIDKDKEVEDAYSIYKVVGLNGFIVYSVTRGMYAYTDDISVDPRTLEYYNTEESAIKTAGFPITENRVVKIYHENGKEETYSYGEFLKKYENNRKLIKRIKNLKIGQSFFYEDKTKQLLVTLELKEGIERKTNG